MIYDLFRTAGEFFIWLAKNALITAAILSPYALDALLDKYLTENTLPPTSEQAKIEQ